MSKKLIVILALAIVVGFSAAAFAEVQNVKVSGDFTATGVIRNQLDLTKTNTGNDPGNADAWISHTRVKIDANLTDNVDFTVRLLNERVWGGTAGTSASTSASEVDIAQAFVTMKEFMKDTVGFPWTMVVGKQAIKLGSGLLVGAAGTNQSNTTQLPTMLGDFSKRSSFDSIVNVMDFSPVTLTAAFVKASEGAITTGRDENVYALNAAFNLGEDYKNAVIEGVYVLAAQRKNNINNLGGRVVVSPMENLGVEAEYVYQTSRTNGTMDDYWDDATHKTKAADAIRLAASLGMPDVVWAPTFSLDYERLSSRWNKMHESWTPAELVNLIFPNTMVTCVGAGISAKPMDDLMLKLRVANFALTKKWVDDGAGNLFGSTGTGFNYVMEPGKKQLGNEIDLGLAYDYTSDVQFGLSYGMFKPGKAFHEDNRKTASSVVGSMKVSF